MAQKSIKMSKISIHALREEGDGVSPASRKALLHFYPRPPRGGRPYRISSPSVSFAFLSTPSARRATRIHAYQRRSNRISIHALREEGDSWASGWFLRFSYFYPRPPRGGRRGDTQDSCAAESISIHALREEGDLSVSGVTSVGSIFLSTPSARRATGAFCPLRRGFEISIHALREEGDSNTRNI